MKVKILILGQITPDKFKIKSKAFYSQGWKGLRGYKYKTRGFGF
jgi:hypothetical protein